MKTAEHGVTVPQELYQGDNRNFLGKIKDKGINFGLEVAKYSPIVTAPIVIYAAVTGPLTAVGAAGLAALDIVGSYGAGKLKESREKKGLTQDSFFAYDGQQAAQHAQGLRKEGGAIYQVKQLFRDVRNQIAPQRMQTAAV